MGLTVAPPKGYQAPVEAERRPTPPENACCETWQPAMSQKKRGMC